MSRRGFVSSRAFSRVILLSFAILGGCYESSTPLGPAERGVVNPEFLGTWTCRNAADDANAKTLLVVAFDSSRYFLEWRDKEETTRWAAHSSIVGGALLHNVRELKADGRDTKWVFLRALAPTESELLLWLVKDDSLKELGEPQALREIRRRVKDESLYKPWATCMRA
ncbi:MAG TPA: hypothetical protein VFV55_03780 [Usitatibacteraceae bacterium]|nr:hypothetical protein [Usitatibacteraceae bacterium]